LSSSTSASASTSNYQYPVSDYDLSRQKSIPTPSRAFSWSAIPPSPPIKNTSFYSTLPLNSHNVLNTFPIVGRLHRSYSYDEKCNLNANGGYECLTPSPRNEVSLTEVLTSASYIARDSPIWTAIASISYSRLNAVKAGYLWKRTFERKNRWKKQLFLLTANGFLYYFDSPRQLSPSGVLYIGQCAVFEEPSLSLDRVASSSLLLKSKSKRPRHAFSIRAQRGFSLTQRREYRQRQYFFMCATFSELNEWVGIVRRLCTDEYLLKNISDDEHFSIELQQQSFFLQPKSTELAAPKLEFKESEVEKELPILIEISASKSSSQFDLDLDISLPSSVTSE
jgi:hypothetical protein